MIAVAEPRETVAADWWASLAHGGLLVAPSKIAEFFGVDLAPLAPYVVDRLRRDVTNVRDGGDVAPLLDTVLEGVLALEPGGWLNGAQVGPDWGRRLATRETLKPRRVWRGGEGAVLPVFVEAASGRLATGRGRRAASRVVEWLRRADLKVALLTNGRQWRLVHAGPDYDAWAEWDVALWFEEGEPGPQVHALRALLGATAWEARSAGEPPRLLAAIAASRKGQSELSEELGERVRRAVELLVRESAASLEPLDAEGPDRVDRRDVYVAACRIVMRAVVVLFAEARGLLPRESPVYEESYSLQGLRQELERRSGGRATERLKHGYGAWPRMLSLFRLVHAGSSHQALEVPRYGGKLFEQGDADSSDGVSRALAALESPANVRDDAFVHALLELLAVSRVKVRQGTRTTWVPAPVDFSDLSSEYIGILYEGLLDFELRRAPADQPIVFLAIGDEPALPFERLDRMTNAELKALFGKLKELAKKRKAAGPDADDAGEGSSDEPEADEPDADDDAPSEDDVAAKDGLTPTEREMVQLWAERSVREAGLVRRPRGFDDAVVRAGWDRQVTTAARRLVKRVVLPGEWFLVRWGGTRKGSGTFYTRPQLAVPTVWRALLPLAFDAPERDSQPDELAPAGEWTPKAPGAIVALKVCDPAMGSGSFLVAALRFLTDALWQSLLAHGWIVQDDAGEVRLGDPPNPVPRWLLESVRDLPLATDRPEEMARARLKRVVVERCLYGVDFDPLAVELGRLALWVETMDRYLPFEFLDHKLKCGNALVGCWFNQFRDYPVLAWEREGGDKEYSNGVHFKKGAWTAAIKTYRNGAVREALRRNPDQGSLLDGWSERPAESVHDDAVARLEQLHARPLVDQEAREAEYRAMVEDEVFQELKAAFDRWCALWFWPADQLERAPLPTDFGVPSAETRRVAAALAREHRFFHWELEFPDVFANPGSGFDAIVGNPPWEAKKPNSMEFFSSIDPLYRTYGKQEAVGVQRRIFGSSEADERAWMLYAAGFKSLSNFTGNAFAPWGDPQIDGAPNCNPHEGKGSKAKNAALHAEWRAARATRTRYADSKHPYQRQGGGDVNTYKLFLEMSHAVLRDGGSLGMLVPSGVYTDDGTQELRAVFLGQCAWTSVYAFQNERFIFGNIDHRFKIAVVHLRKGGVTETLRTRFRLGPGDSPEIQEIESDLLDLGRFLSVATLDIRRFSPKSLAILEIRSDRDLAITERLYATGITLGDQSRNGWRVTYSTEFHMTGGSSLFPPRAIWQEQGYAPDEYGHWLKGNWIAYDSATSVLVRDRDLILSDDGSRCMRLEEIEGVALPIFEGRMINHFDFSEKGWVSGKGRKAVWRDIGWTEKRIEPQFLIALKNVGDREVGQGWKIVFMDICSSTNTRTFYGTVDSWAACGHSAPTLRTPESDLATSLHLTGLLNSFPSDYLFRSRIGGQHLTWNYLEETSLPRLSHGGPGIRDAITLHVARLSLSHIRFACAWREVAQSYPELREQNWKQLFSVTRFERLRLRASLEALVAMQYGLGPEELAWILRECDYPSNLVNSPSFSRGFDPKGFWRVDRDDDPELRLPVLAQIAHRDLIEMGLEAFLAQNAGEGWTLPETLRLADHGLGHDDRAKEHQPVASRLGPRFYDWQLEQSPEESWEECARHVELLRRILPGLADDAEASDPGREAGPVQTELFDLGVATQTDLFEK